MSTVENAKKEYFKNRYEQNPEGQKKANNKYWIKKAQDELGKQDVTEEEIKSVRNNYYKKYRNANKDKIQKIQQDFWERKANEM